MVYSSLEMSWTEYISAMPHMLLQFNIMRMWYSDSSEPHRSQNYVLNILIMETNFENLKRFVCYSICIWFTVVIQCNYY